MSKSKGIKNPRTLTIIGNIASGKSSAAPMLVKLLRADFLDADNLFQTADPFRNAYLQDQQRWAFTNELWLTQKRAALLRYKLTQTKKPWLVVDSGVLMSWAYTYSHYLAGNLTAKEWHFYDQLLPQLAGDVFSATTVIKLEYSIPTLLARIRHRGRAFEINHYRAAYLAQIEKGLAALERRLHKFRLPFLKITEANIGDFVNSPADKSAFLQLCQEFLL